MDQMELVKNNDTMPCKRNFNSDDEIEKNLHPMKKQTTKLIENRKCPYLDTINRHVLDFDFEKLCSVSLSRINVYACLVCGKYFQGRGTFTHANTHSFDKGHYVFINLKTLKFYCLPDNYEIIDSSLEDIKYVLKPTFTLQHIQKLEVNDKLSLGGATYLPGIVGLNNIKANDYCNVILQALSQVPQLRNYFLREESYNKIRRSPGDNMFLLVERFGELLRKLWNPRNFKSHVSPHEMLQAVVLCSSKRFQITEQGDPIDFLSWFLNALHRALGGTGKTTSSVVYRTFRGKMRIYSRKMPFVKKDLKKEEIREIKQEFQESLEEFFVKIEESSFLYLTVDLPSTPLFTDNIQNCIPQVPLYNILSKFDGKKEKEYKSGKKSIIKRFEITKLPPYLILYIKRFTKNTFFVEKNTTIVNFPMKNIDLSHILSPEVKAKMPNASYNLLACIVHDGDPKAGKGTYRVHVLHKGTGKWFEMQDLHVTEILPQMIPLSEAYIQIYELRKQQGTSESDQ